MTSHDHLDRPTHLGDVPETAVVDPRLQRQILIAVCIALTAVMASVSGLNVALQQLSADLGASQTDLLWVVNGYTIALAALLLPLGAVGDRWGRKHVLVSGLVLFIAANLGGAMASSTGMLIGWRVLAGVAAAMIMPATLSVITSSFPAEQRGRAIGVWSGFAGGGGILGLLLSAFLIDRVTWPWLFVAPCVLAAVSLVWSLKVVPHSKEHHDWAFDTVGAVLSAVMLGSLVLGIHQGPESGWTAPLTLLGLGAGVAATAGFVWWELRHAHPLIDLRVFRSRPLAASTVTLTFTFAVLMALFLVLIQFLQAVLGWTAMHAALGLLPMILLMMPMSAVAPKIAERVGLRVMLVTGGLLMTAGLASMALLGSISGGYLSVLPGLVLFSLGTGVAMSPGTTAITGSLPEESQGVASALNDTVREFGGALGIALIGSALSSAYSSNVAPATVGLPHEAASAIKAGIGGALVVAPHLGAAGPAIVAAARTAFVDGWRVAIWISAGVVLAASVFAFVWTPPHVRTEPVEGLEIDDMVPAEV